MVALQPLISCWPSPRPLDSSMLRSDSVVAPASAEVSATNHLLDLLESAYSARS